MGTEESEPTPQAIVEPISGVLYPGMGDSYGRFFETKGAPIYVTVNWDPPYPIYVAIVSETGYVRGGEVHGGSWSGVINAPDTGKKRALFCNKP